MRATILYSLRRHSPWSRTFYALACLLLLTSCENTLNIPQVSKEAYQQYRLEIDNKKEIVEQACVVIDGQDIQLPLTSGSTRPQENRTYSFYVWAYSPDSAEPLYKQWENGTFQVDVIGVKAAISVPDYRQQITVPQNLIQKPGSNDFTSTSSLQSQNVLEIKVRSDDIDRGFTIVAWYPVKYKAFKRQKALDGTNAVYNTNQYGVPLEYSSSKNPWGQRRDVKVYNGDLRTHVEIVDDKEAESSFGKPFTKYFYAGRIYLRNRNKDKSMVVYTTSLRANVLLYRPPSKDQISAPTTAKEPLPPPKLNDQMLGNQLKIATNQITLLTNRMLRDYTNETNFMSYHLTLEERDLLISKARRVYAEIGRSNKTVFEDKADEIVKHSLIEKTQEIRNQEKGDILVFWNQISQNVDRLRFNCSSVRDQARGLIESQIVDVKYSPTVTYSDPPNSKTNTATQLKQAARENIVHGFERMARATGPDLDLVYAALTNQMCVCCASVNEVGRWLTNASIAHAELADAQRCFALADALARQSPPSTADINKNPLLSGIDKEYADVMQKLETSAFGSLSDKPPGNPFDSRKSIHVNPDDRALAFSEDSDREVDLNKVGYLWHETLRPMTFQAVLNSLMYTHDNSTAAWTVKLLQSAATVAGGMTGMGAFIREFRSEGYSGTVSVVSTIFIPEISKLIMEDLNKHIRNLGEMGMDTVVVVPPNGVVDRYIFFPKGPIYNYVDEFDVRTPAYIKRVGNDDVSVEATLIDSGIQVSAGQTSQELTERALNEGKADLDGNITKQLALQDSLRAFQLKSVTTQIQSLFANLVVGTNGMKSPQQTLAETKACALVRKFERDYGVENSGTLATLLAQYNVDCDATTPPTVLTASLPSPKLLAGIPSKWFSLPVLETKGNWTLGISNLTSDANLIPAANVKIKPVSMGMDAMPQFMLVSTTNLTPGSSAMVNITFVITNSAGLGTNAVVPVTIYAPTMEYLPAGAEIVSGGVAINDNRNALVNLSLPVYDSDPANATNWTFAAQVLGSLNGWILSTNTPSTNYSGKASPSMESQIILDGSLTTAPDPFKLNLSFTFGTNLVFQTNFTARKGNQ